MKRQIAMLVLAVGMCWGLASRATTVSLALPQDDKMQSGDKMKDEKMARDKTTKKSKKHKKDKMTSDKMKDEKMMEEKK